MSQQKASIGQEEEMGVAEVDRGKKIGHGVTESNSAILLLDLIIYHF